MFAEHPGASFSCAKAVVDLGVWENLLYLLEQRVRQRRRANRNLMDASQIKLADEVPLAHDHCKHRRNAREDRAAVSRDTFKIAAWLEAWQGNNRDAIGQCDRHEE